MKGHIGWWHVKNAQKILSWWSCEAMGLDQAYPHCCFFCIKLCSLFVASDFFCYVVIQ